MDVSLTSSTTQSQIFFAPSLQGLFVTSVTFPAAMSKGYRGKRDHLGGDCVFEVTLQRYLTIKFCGEKNTGRAFVFLFYSAMLGCIYTTVMELWGSNRILGKNKVNLPE